MKRNSFLTASILCYCLALILPTVKDSGIIGAGLLFNGWIFLIELTPSSIPVGLAWLANFIYFFNVVLSNNMKIGYQILTSLITIGASFSIFFLTEFNEGVEGMINIGAWFWLLSFIVLLIGQIHLSVKNDKTRI